MSYKRAKTTPKGKIPVDKNTHGLVEHVHWNEKNEYFESRNGYIYGYKESDIEWIDPPEIYGFGEIYGFNQENLLSIKLHRTDQYAGLYRMRQKDVLEMLTQEDGLELRKGMIRGRWTFVKGGEHGRTFGIKYLGR